MNLHEEVELEDYVQRPEKLSAAEITAICQEAGLHAVRANRYTVMNKDFEKGTRAHCELYVLLTAFRIRSVQEQRQEV